MNVLNAATILFNNRRQNQFHSLIGREALIAFHTTAAAANRITLIRYPSIEYLGVVVMAEGAAQSEPFVNSL